jgi:hypothetical protein
MQASSSYDWKDEMFGDDSSGDDDVVSETTAVTLPVSFEMKEMMDVGGGRGLFATMHITAGSLVLAEVPVLPWSLNSDSLGNTEALFITVQRVLNAPNAHHSTKFLYPTVLSAAIPEEVKKMRQLWTEDALQSTLAIITTSNPNKEIDTNEILRVSLVLQHNGFSSGLYQLLCMINHSCEPNCVKFSPVRPNGWQCASEIWTSRDILAGEELTICYCASPEMTHTSRQEYLSAHHGFSCRCPRCVVSEQDEDGSSASYAMEIDLDRLTATMETACSTSPQETQDGTSAGTNKSAKQAAIRHLVEKVTPLFWECRDPLLALLKHHWSTLADVTATTSDEDKKQKAKVQWTDEVSLLTRLLKHVIRLCAVRVNLLQVLFPVVTGVQDSPVTAGAPPVHPKLLQGVIEYVVYTTALRYAQESFLPPLHPDFTQTFFDLVESSSLLLTLLQQARHDDGEDSLISTVQLEEVVESILNQYPSSLRESIGSKAKCSRASEEAKLRYRDMKNMYNSTFLRLKDVLEVSRRVAQTAFSSDDEQQLNDTV